MCFDFAYIFNGLLNTFCVALWLWGYADFSVNHLNTPLCGMISTQTECYNLHEVGFIAGLLHWIALGVPLKW